MSSPKSWQLCLGMMTSSSGNIVGATGSLCGEFTGQRWFPCTKACDAELRCFLWSAPEWMVMSKQSWSWWFETPLCPLWRHCDAPMCFKLCPCLIRQTYPAYKAHILSDMYICYRADAAEIRTCKISWSRLHVTDWFISRTLSPVLVQMLCSKWTLDLSSYLNSIFWLHS